MTDKEPAPAAGVEALLTTIRHVLEEAKSGDESRGQDTDDVDDAIAALDRLSAALRAASADAGRYRWLRDDCDWNNFPKKATGGEGLDRLCDAALAAMEPKP